ncbi:MAG: 16S rRNA (adenine(1518)-N(6)/adenine(1519)-N(6))-dimethyltransferase RsmA [Candidatus Shikimatogenerans bostrichidophilus]|nr:MAG: 16S rRNA (adenine(1518)-N(6)/adenine(1519)-N(6))-dimethyltransferase RsmA [Candidatus Shikimatogenerans bostrichidophilus]
MIIKKYYSQNFLKNNIISKKIIELLYITKKKYDCILEIGPGLGILSKEIIKISKNFLLVEIDKFLVNYIKKKFYKYKKNIINKNILNLKLKNIKKYKKFYIIGNFPYNISSKLLLWIIKNRNNIVECIGTFQQEFINSIILKKTRLSFIFNIYFKIKKKFKIDKNNFYPIPKVDSLVVKIINKKKEIKKINKKKFFFLIKETFKYKRKILKNSLKYYIIQKNIKYKNYKIFFKRPEQLSIKDFKNLYKIIYK